MFKTSRTIRNRVQLARWRALLVPTGRQVSTIRRSPPPLVHRSYVAIAHFRARPRDTTSQELFNPRFEVLKNPDHRLPPARCTGVSSLYSPSSLRPHIRPLLFLDFQHGPNEQEALHCEYLYCLYSTLPCVTQPKGSDSANRHRRQTIRADRRLA